jgi:hypothetical protein
MRRAGGAVGAAAHQVRALAGARRSRAGGPFNADEAGQDGYLSTIRSDARSYSVLSTSGLTLMRNGTTPTVAVKRGRSGNRPSGHNATPLSRGGSGPAGTLPETQPRIWVTGIDVRAVESGVVHLSDHERWPQGVLPATWSPPGACHRHGPTRAVHGNVVDEQHPADGVRLGQDSRDRAQPATANRCVQRIAELEIALGNVLADSNPAPPALRMAGYVPRRR